MENERKKLKKLIKEMDDVKVKMALKILIELIDQKKNTSDTPALP